MKPKLKRPATLAAAHGSASRRALIIAIEVLALYADPESYHGIAMICDRPSGWFADDVSKTGHPHYDRKMHGAAARKALVKIQKLVKPNDPSSAT